MTHLLHLHVILWALQTLTNLFTAYFNFNSTKVTTMAHHKCNPFAFFFLMLTETSLFVIYRSDYLRVKHLHSLTMAHKGSFVAVMMLATAFSISPASDPIYYSFIVLLNSQLQSSKSWPIQRNQPAKPHTLYSSTTLLLAWERRSWAALSFPEHSQRSLFIY